MHKYPDLSPIIWIMIAVLALLVVAPILIFFPWPASPPAPVTLAPSPTWTALPPSSTPTSAPSDTPPPIVSGAPTVWGAPATSTPTAAAPTHTTTPTPAATSTPTPWGANNKLEDPTRAPNPEPRPEPVEGPATLPITGGQPQARHLWLLTPLVGIVALLTLALITAIVDDYVH